MMKIAIVDDFPLMRRGLAAILTDEADIELVGEAASRQEAINIINNKNPDIVLMDLKLGIDSGLDIVKECSKEYNTCKFIIFTSSAEEADFKRAYEMGVEGYILKEALPEELLYAIRLVSKGRKFYDSNLLELVMRGESHSAISELTPRELDVLIVLGSGLNNSLIARKLYITEFTVKKHISQILSKLNLADRTQAALYANSKGLVKN